MTYEGIIHKENANISVGSYSKPFEGEISHVGHKDEIYFHTSVNKENGPFPLNQRVQLGLDAISKLSNDWDSYGAIAPTSETIELVKKLVIKMPTKTQPEIAPDSDGGIGLYWKDQREIYFKVNHKIQESTLFMIENDEETEYVVGKATYAKLIAAAEVIINDGYLSE